MEEKEAMKKRTQKKGRFDNGKLLIWASVLFIFLVLVAVAFAPASYLRTQSLQTGSCDCGAGHSLVCSTDGHTYTSYCEGTCKGREILHLGECF